MVREFVHSGNIMPKAREDRVCIIDKSGKKISGAFGREIIRELRRNTAIQPGD